MSLAAAVAGAWANNAEASRVGLFATFVVALMASVLLVPPLRRYAAHLGLLDQPDPRKVHKRSVPRSGGLAIVLGALLSTVLWVPGDPLLRGLIIGGMVIAFFGYLDDRLDLDFRLKFLGQAIAAIIAMQGGLLIDVWPFLGKAPVPEPLAWTVTFLFLLGLTNAINFSDGLDGLAGGISLVALGAIAYVAHAFIASDLLSDPEFVVELLPRAYGVEVLAIAIMGGLCGFLRYNNYPARIFMGDAGSQFLGFMTAGLAVVLTQHLDPALNPALVLLILGLPILDTLCVVIWRVRRGESPFRPDRRHFHHRLLDLGFRHYEAVATIYLVHGLLVLTALLVRFEGDAVVVGICLFASAAIIVFFRWARVSDWMLRPLPDPATARERRNVALRRLDWLPRASALTVQLALGAFMLLAGIAPLADRSVEEQRLLAMLSLPLGIMLLLTLGFGGRWRHALRRLLLYASGLLVAYVLSDVLAASLLVNGLVLLIALAVVVAVRVTRRDQFSTTPLDVLILLFVVVFLLVNAGAEGGFAASGVDDVARLVVLFYAIELLLSKGDRYLHLLSALTGTGLLVLGMRAVLG